MHRSPRTGAALRPTDSKEQPYCTSPLDLLSGAEFGHDRRYAAALATQRMLQQRGSLFCMWWRETCRQSAEPPGDSRPWERKFVSDLPAFPLLTEIAECVFGLADA